MKLTYWMTAKGIVELFFGLGFVLIPETVGAIFGINLSPGGAFLARLFGAEFIFGSIVLWLARNAPRTDTTLRGIVLAAVVSNTIGFLVTLLATLSGVWNAVGWLPVALNLVFALGFAYFQWVKPPSQVA